MTCRRRWVRLGFGTGGGGVVGGEGVGTRGSWGGEVGDGKADECSMRWQRDMT